MLLDAGQILLPHPAHFGKKGQLFAKKRVVMPG
jgi:hypothetical protein